MNRKNLTAAVLAGLAGAAGIVGSAQAVNVNPDGLGQVLIYPYYTVNGGNTTLLSVVNTSEDAKAVKVRFLEGKNSREVLDFNLYMSAYDVWTASLKNVAGVPTMKTADTSCTVPYIYGNGGSQEFLPWGMNDIDLDDDTVYDTIDRAAEGHFEMIEMGILVAESESAVAATHVDGVPDDCAALVAAWTDPDNLVANDEGWWLNNVMYDGPFTDMDDPEGGLFGGAAIVNVQKGTMYSYDAKAINGFADSIDANDILHTPPGFTTPNLNSGDRWDGTVFMDDGSLFMSDGLTRGVDAVSFVFMHDQVMNEYTTEAVVGAGTEWVISFPTKHFYVDEVISGSEDALAPFTTTWDGSGACEVVLLDTIWDREEASPEDPVIEGEPVPPIVSPAPPNEVITPDPIIPFELCYEVSVIEFGAPTGMGYTSILGSTNFHNIDNTLLGFEYGWARMQLDDYPYDENENGLIDDDEAEFSRDHLGGLEGLPVTGFAVQAFQNAFLGDGADVLANYGGIFGHKGTRMQSGSMCCEKMEN
jgi:hypothetical protein